VAAPGCDGKTRTDEVFRLVNEERAVRNLDPLHRVSKLDIAADERAEDMATRDYFAHISPEGLTPGDQILSVGYEALLCGENIASGYTTPREVVQAWMASPAHRANILEPRYRDIGLAYVEAPGTDSGVLWVQEFGEPLPNRLTRRERRVSDRHSSSPRQPLTRMSRVTAGGS
jgi:uncharacterized protein YkwD